MLTKIIHKLFSEKGQALVETGLIIVLVSIVAITALTATGQCVNSGFDNIATVLEADTGGTGGGDKVKLVPTVADTTFYKADGTLLTPEVDKYEDIAYCVGPKKVWQNGTAQGCGTTEDDTDGMGNTSKALPNLKDVSGSIWMYCNQMQTLTEDTGWYVPAIGELAAKINGGNSITSTGTMWSSTESAMNARTYAYAISNSGTASPMAMKNAAMTTVLFRGAKTQGNQ